MNNLHGQDNSTYGMIELSLERLNELEKNQILSSEENEKTKLALFKSQAAMYEEMQVNRLSQMKANADIYEAILSNGGNI